MTHSYSTWYVINWNTSNFRICTVNRCYRAETAETEKGIYRVHQFYKVVEQHDVNLVVQLAIEYYIF